MPETSLGAILEADLHTPQSKAPLYFPKPIDCPTFAFIILLLFLHQINNILFILSVVLYAIISVSFRRPVFYHRSNLFYFFF